MIVKNVTGTVLAVLRVLLELNRPAYGMEIAVRAHMHRGSCYEILKRLVSTGCLIAEWEGEQPDGRPPRRYYALVPEKRGEIVDLLTERGIDLPEVPW